MEPERPLVDRKVLDFVNEHFFDPADFVIRTDGVCRLNPEMARCVVGLVEGHPCADISIYRSKSSCLALTKQGFFGFRGPDE
jgi:hypothetical protein